MILLDKNVLIRTVALDKGSSVQLSQTAYLLVGITEIERLSVGSFCFPAFSYSLVTRADFHSLDRSYQLNSTKFSYISDLGQLNCYLELRRNPVMPQNMGLFTNCILHSGKHHVTKI